MHPKHARGRPRPTHNAAAVFCALPSTSTPMDKPPPRGTAPRPFPAPSHHTRHSPSPSCCARHLHPLQEFDRAYSELADTNKGHYNGYFTQVGRGALALCVVLVCVRVEGGCMCCMRTSHAHHGPHQTASQQKAGGAGRMMMHPLCHPPPPPSHKRTRMHAHRPTRSNLHPSPLNHQQPLPHH